MARAVIPTSSSLAAFSDTVLAPVSLSEISPMALSVSPLPAVVPSASVRLIVMSALDVEPSVDVASTVIVCDGVVSKSS